MSPKQWLALFCFYISYLFFGASVFYHIEHELEAQRRAIDLQNRIDINEILVKYTAPNDSDIQDEILKRVSDYCGKSVTNYTLDGHADPMVWSFYHAFFLSFTVCSTVGYGNISPTNTLSRMFMIFYALIGIPVNGFLFAYLGEFFGRAFMSAHERYKQYKMATRKNYVPHRLGLIAQIIIYLLPGVVIFLFLPALLFSYFEDWPYTVSVYYSFVTLSTIGFGDFVPTFQPQQEETFGFLFHIYEVFIIFWFIFGLGYLVMVMGFIAKGLQSKHITRLEHQLSENIRSTQNRIWNGVTKDVSYLRRILNEVYMMKFKPVYSDEPDEEEDVEFKTVRRSSSCPNLTMYCEQSPPPMRKRAKSVFHPADADLLRSATLDRTHSESDLSRINRKRTFDESNIISRPDAILAQVVSALGTISATSEDEDYESDMEDGGIHGFSDSQILASERTGSGWSLAHSDGSTAIPPLKERGRAASDFRPPEHLLADNDQHKWTWSGNNSQIKEFRRQLNKGKGNDLYRASFALPKSAMNGHSVTINVPDDKLDISPARTMWEKLNPFKKRSLADRRGSMNPNQADIQKYLESTGAGRNTRKSISPMGRRASMAPDQAEIQKYLERTGAGRNTRKSISPMGRRVSMAPDQAEIQKYLERTGAGRNTRKSISARQYLTNTSRRRPSTVSGLSTTDESSGDILENTTIADLIRALEVVHTKANTHDTPLLQEYFNVPKRKLGTASLTPPSGLPPLLGLFAVPTDYGRRGSVKPSSTHTPVLNRANMGRRQSNILDFVGSTQRRMSLRPTTPSSQPPPYSEKPKIMHRRFSVRPTALSIAPGQAPSPSYTPSKQATSGVQRKLSMVPSPLTRDHHTLGITPSLRSSVRFVRTHSTTSSGNVTPTFTGTPLTRKRDAVYRSAALALPEPSIPLQRLRTGSVAHIFQRNVGRKRTESK